MGREAMMLVIRVLSLVEGFNEFEGKDWSWS